MKKISTHTFKYTMRDIHKNTENRKFCFVIGAGASYKSGIPTGGQLATKWFEEIKERYSDKEFHKWVTSEKINIKELAAHYGSIYRKRFESDKTSGYEFLVQAMRSSKPTFGHIVLAQILSKTNGHCVLTTNFDSLVETSIYQFTDKTPLVCGHESLSGYARPSNIHPLIIKIHRDLLLSPQSDPDEINNLNEGWEEPLNNIFSSHIPIIIGYGGNDGSLMSYFEQMNKPSNFFWCKLKKSRVSTRVEKLIHQMDGNLVEIDGFDEIMHELLWVFDDIKPIKEELDKITKSRIESVNKYLTEMNYDSSKTNKEKSDVKKEFSAFEYSEMAEKESDYDKRRAVYLDALNNFPKTGWLWNEFTNFMLNIKKDYTNLNEYFLEALSIDPENLNINTNYALYLSEIKKDFENAEKYYLKALSLKSGDIDLIINYANFLSDQKRDYVNANNYYLKALSIGPNDAHSYGVYAIFLKDIKNYEKAEEYYLKALSIDPKYGWLSSIYADFLSDDKHDYEKAEEYHNKALSFEPNDSWINESYAIYLQRYKEDYKYSEKYHLKALSIEPDDPGLNGNYAQFLLISNRIDEATQYLDKAFSLIKTYETDLLLELWFYKYAHFIDTIKESEKEIRKLLKEGIRSLGWDLSLNVNIAIKNGHPNPRKLKEYAKKITTESPVEYKKAT